MSWNLENGWVLSHAMGRSRRNACECRDCDGTGQVQSCTEHEDCGGREECPGCLEHRGNLDVGCIPCPGCGDQLEIDPNCTQCNGEGSLPCPDCDGGFIPCEFYGEQECSTCSGTGEDDDEADPDDRD
jgi:hypothetical protein